MIFATTVIFNISEVFCKPVLVESRFRVRRNTWRCDHSGVNFCFKGNEGELLTVSLHSGPTSAFQKTIFTPPPN